ncbi:heterodisulfide reductase subunit C [bacterium SM23_31]|nr:MAG: heterodisulfide reductase subunit C [bacterium SM23_31]
MYEQVNESVFRCYQCGKCSAGCPLSEDMDYPPSQLMRMLQLETPEVEANILRSYTIWLCLTCETCIARCPQEVDIPKIMDFLRSESLRRKKVHPSAKDIISFHKSFLDSIKYTGRLHEVGLIAGYKFRTYHLLKDLPVAPKLFLRGKLKLFPHFIKGKSVISRIFTKTFREYKGKEAEK